MTILESIKDAVKKTSSKLLLDPLEPILRKEAEEEVSEWREELLDAMPRKLPDLLRDTDDPDPEDDGVFEKIRDTVLGKIADALEGHLEEFVEWVRTDKRQDVDEGTREVSDFVVEAGMKSLKKTLHLVPSNGDEEGTRERGLFGFGGADDKKDGEDTDGGGKNSKLSVDYHVQNMQDRVRQHLHPKLESLEAKLKETYPALFRQAAVRYFCGSEEEKQSDRGLGDYLTNLASSFASNHPNTTGKVIDSAVRVLRGPMDKFINHKVGDLEEKLVGKTGDKARGFLEKIPGMH